MTDPGSLASRGSTYCGIEVERHGVEHKEHGRSR